MNSKNTVAAILAVYVMTIFLGVFIFLAFGKVDPSNKEYFNTSLIALISCVTTAFGYYLGSSFGSTRKNEIMAQVPPTSRLEAYTSLAPIVKGEAIAVPESGFIRAPLLFILLLLIVGLLAGCATGTGTAKPETPQSIAAKTLLSTRQGVIGAATGIDEVCTQGLLKQQECTAAKVVYEQAEDIWPAAADAFLLYLVFGDPATKQKYDDVQKQFDNLFSDLNKITTTFQGVK